MKSNMTLEEKEKIIAELKEYKENLYKTLEGIKRLLSELYETENALILPEPFEIHEKIYKLAELIELLDKIINVFERDRLQWVDAAEMLSFPNCPIPEKKGLFSGLRDKIKNKKPENGNIELPRPQANHVVVNGQLGMGKSKLNLGDFSDDSVIVCGNCGCFVEANCKFCIKCGHMVLSPQKNISVSQVQFSAIAPKTFIKDEYTMLEIYMYEEAFRHIVDEALKNENSLKESRSGFLSVDDKTSIGIEISSPDIEIDDNYDEQIWSGKYLKFDFAVFLPENYSKKQILFVAKVYFNGIPATKLKFTAQCKTAHEQKMEILREDVLSAFISYASQDRSRVAAIIQGMKKARPDIDIFFDVENLRSGDNWEKTLMTEISRRDILFLCWSLNAKASKWVDREWRYALSDKGPDGIEPIPIDPPDICPPPKELDSKHFNDRELLYINRDKNGITSSSPREKEESAFLMRYRNNDLIPIRSKEFFIGRDGEETDHCITDNPRISKLHAKIQLSEGRYYIVDCNSTNGTYIDGVRIESEMKTELTDKCEIMLADEKYRFFAPVN